MFDLTSDSYGPEELWLYYERSQEALIALNEKIDSGVFVSTFAGMSSDEILVALEDMGKKLDEQVTASLVASFEAVIRLDFLQRASRKIKTGPRQELSSLAKAYGRAVPFEKILDVWSEYSGAKQISGQLKQLYRYRHWLVHGRYWHQKSGLRAVDPARAWQIGEQFFRAHPEIGIQLGL